MTDHLFKIGPWLVNSNNDTISSDGQVIKLEPRTMKVLLILADHGGDVVSRNHLLETVWHRLEVTENSLNQSIRALRKAFGDNRTSPEYIQTVPKKGYRLIAQVTPADSDGPDPQPGSSTTAISHKGLGIGMVLLLGAVLIAVLMNKGNHPASMHEGAIRPVTVLKGNAFAPDFSPDGQFITFSHRRDSASPWQIYLSDLTHKEVRKLTEGSAKDDSPQWHPFKPQIAFHRRSEVHCGIYLLALSPDFQQVFDETLLTECDPSSYNIRLAWTRDGDGLYFSDGESSSDPYRVYHYSLLTEKRTQVTNPTQGHRGDYAISMFADGRFLAILRNRAWTDTELHVLDTESRELQLVRDFTGILDSIAWHSSNHVLVGNRHGMLQLVDLTSGDTERFLQRSDNAYSPDVDFKTGKVVFVSGPKVQTDVMIRPNPRVESEPMAADSDPMTDLVNTTRNELRPVFANHSNQFVFVSGRTGLPQIWHSDGQSNTRQLSFFDEQYDMKYLRWSPDDRLILSNLMGRLFVINVEDGEMTWLTNATSQAVFGNWSRDGKSIYFASDRSKDWQVWKLTVDSGLSEQVTFNGGANMQESPDGSTLFYTKYEKDGLWKRQIGQSNEELLIQGFPALRWDSWHVVEQGIYYSSGGLKEHELRFFDFLDNSEHVLMMRRNTLIAAFSVSFDQRFIALSEQVNTNSEIMLYEALK